MFWLVYLFVYKLFVFGFIGRGELRDGLDYFVWDGRVVFGGY